MSTANSGSLLRDNFTSSGHEFAKLQRVSISRYGLFLAKNTHLNSDRSASSRGPGCFFIFSHGDNYTGSGLEGQVGFINIFFRCSFFNFGLGFILFLGSC